MDTTVQIWEILVHVVENQRVADEIISFIVTCKIDYSSNLFNFPFQVPLPGIILRLHNLSKLDECLRVNYICNVETKLQIFHDENVLKILIPNLTIKKLKLKNELHTLGCDIVSTYLNSEACKNISTYLKFNATLTHISLSGNKIGVVGSNSIAEGLKLNSCLEKYQFRWESDLFRRCKNNSRSIKI